MGKALRTLVRNVGDVEGLRAYNMGLLQGMLDAGFVQTEDTGQMTSATASGASGISVAYAIFRFDDALQATAPIFFRVDFLNAVNVDGAQQFLTVGRGSDGAGAITGVLYSSPYGVGTSPSTHGTTVPYQYAFSSGEGYAIFQGAVTDYRIGSGSAPYMRSGFIIERSRSHTGAVTGDGILVATQTHLTGTSAVSFNALSGQQEVRAINYSTGTYVAGSAPVMTNLSINGATPGNSTSLAAGSIGPVFPWDVVAPGVAPWRSCVVVSIPAGDIAGSEFQTNLCGQPGNFYPIPCSQTHNRWGVSLVGSSPQQWFGAGIRWED